MTKEEMIEEMVNGSYSPLIHFTLHDVAYVLLAVVATMVFLALLNKIIDMFD